MEKSTKKKGFIVILAICTLIIITVIFAISSREENYIEVTASKEVPRTGEIYLYGEEHGQKVILDEELRLWKEYYNEGFRDLFVELPYYTAQFMNLWMESDNDDILEQLYLDWENTAMHSVDVLDFYRQIKNQCPETVFHGTDVGHQYDSTGQRYIEYLKSNGKEQDEEYNITLDNINQGKDYYSKNDDAYRENAMVANFIRECDKIDGNDVMGIYGAAHTGIKAKAFNTNNLPCMANQLKTYYGDVLYSQDLTELTKNVDVIESQMITIGGKEYEALYYGKEDLTAYGIDYQSRSFWRVEGAYEDVKALKKTGDVLPFNNYPMIIEEEQVFIIDYVQKDGNVARLFYRNDGNTWQGLPVTEEFIWQ